MRGGRGHRQSSKEYKRRGLEAHYSGNKYTGVRTKSRKKKTQRSLGLEPKNRGVKRCLKSESIRE